MCMIHGLIKPTLQSISNLLALIKKIFHNFPLIIQLSQNNWFPPSKQDSRNILWKGRKTRSSRDKLFVNFPSFSCQKPILITAAIAIFTRLLPPMTFWRHNTKIKLAPISKTFGKLSKKKHIIIISVSSTGFSFFSSRKKRLGGWKWAKWRERERRERWEVEKVLIPCAPTQ